MIARLFIVLAIGLGLALGVNWAYGASRLFMMQATSAGSYSYDLLFSSATWLIPVSIFAGIFVASLVGEKREAYIDENNKVLRHDETMFFQHWSHAIATLILLGSGITLGFLIFPRLISSVENVGFVLNLHFIAANLFLFTVFFHVTRNILTGEIKDNMPAKGDISDGIGHYMAMFGLKDPPEEGKYLASERLSYPMWGVFVGAIILSGLTKVAAYAWSLPEGLMLTMKWVHGISTVGMLLLLVVHIFLSAIIPPSWPMIRSMITGYMSASHIEKHHVKWYKEIKDNKAPEPNQEEVAREIKEQTI